MSPVACGGQKRAKSTRFLGAGATGGGGKLPDMDIFEIKLGSYEKVVHILRQFSSVPCIFYKSKGYTLK